MGGLWNDYLDRLDKAWNTPEILQTPQNKADIAISIILIALLILAIAGVFIAFFKVLESCRRNQVWAKIKSKITGKS